MFVEDPFLALSHRDIFTAHEAIQLYTLVNKNNMYERFIKANQWIFHYLPNATFKKTRSCRESSFWIFWPLDFLAKYVQLFFINMHKTKERVDAHFLAFHPYDHRLKTLSRFKTKVQLYEI